MQCDTALSPDSSQFDTAPSRTDSAQYDTAWSQQFKFTADPKVSNTAWSRTPRSVILRSFARNNFVSEGLSLPSMRILKILTCLSGGPDGFNSWKKIKVKNLVTLPL